MPLDWICGLIDWFPCKVVVGTMRLSRETFLVGKLRGLWFYDERKSDRSSNAELVCKLAKSRMLRAEMYYFSIVSNLIMQTV